MSKYWPVTVPLSVAELRHLLNVLDDAKADGYYYGNQQQYVVRHGRITRKIEDAARVAGMTHDPLLLVPSPGKE